MDKNKKQDISVILPKDLSFSTDYNCCNCQWVNGGKDDKIWCDYYKAYYYPHEGYNCNHFLSK